MISHLVEAAESGRPVFITDVRTAFAAAPAITVDALLILPDGESARSFTIPLPALDDLPAPEAQLLHAYVRAEIYNHLCTLGGYALTLYVGSLLVGGRDAPTLADGEGFVEDLPRLTLAAVERLDDGVLLRYDGPG